MYWILAGVGLLVLFYIFIIYRYNYWARKGIQQRSAFQQFIILLRLLLQTNSQAGIIKELDDDFPNSRYYGAYQLLQPVLHIRDPELIKQITVKDFEHFLDHSQFVPEEIEPLWGKNLFALKGDRWRDMRATLSPSFTSSKMRGMFVFMNECAQQFVQYFKKDNSSKVVDMKDALTRYATDVIATASFGITCDSLNEPKNEFYIMGKEATNLRGFWNNLKFFILLASPTIGKLFGFSIFSKRGSEFFRRLVKSNIESREKNGIVRPDMIHLLMEAKKGRLKHEDESGIIDTGFAVIEESSIGKEEKHQKQQLTDDDLTAQALIFFFAGFENISSAICFLIYEMVVNPDIQQTLRKEIDQLLEKNNGHVTYEALLNLKYMDMVVSETLRKWPIGIGTDRVCAKPYTIKPREKGEVEITLQKSDLVFFNIYAIHRNPQFYPDPDRFDPERFSDENKGDINPYTFLTFGIGPRSCIGNRFALLEIKTIVLHLLANFEIVASKKTQIPLKLAKDQFNLASANGFWFELKPRTA